MKLLRPKNLFNRAQHRCAIISGRLSQHISYVESYANVSWFVHDNNGPVKWSDLREVELTWYANQFVTWLSEFGVQPYMKRSSQRNRYGK